MTIGGSVVLREGEGAFVIKTAGVAGYFSGKATVGPASGRVLVRMNQTGDRGRRDDPGRRAHDQHQVCRRRGHAAGHVFSTSVTGLTLNIGDFVSIEGDVAFDSQGNFAGAGLSIFLGQGPAKLANGDINPLATGVLLTNGRIGLVQTGAGYALVAEGDVSLVGISGITISGHASVRVNTTGQIVLKKTLSIPGSTADPIEVEFKTATVVKSFVVTNAQITVLGQTLSGNLSFESVDGVIAVAASNVTLALPGVSLSNASGALMLTPAGVAGSLRGTLAVTIPGVSFTGSFSVGVNTTAAPVSETFHVGSAEVVLNVPAGPYLRVEGTAVTLNILGQQIGGDFAVERNGTTTTIAARNVHFSLGAGSSGVTLTDGTGAFVVTTAGLAGQVSGRVALTLPAGISVSGDFSLSVNNTSAAVDQTFTVGSDSVHLSLPGGPYLRISATNVQADLLGLRVSGDFSFERSLSLGDDHVPGGMGANADTAIIRIGIANLAFSVGGVVSVSGGSGAFFVLPAGIAGDVQATSRSTCRASRSPAR